jgi:hypothetical protein
MPWFECSAAVVMAKLGAIVAATDLAPNLPLLGDNCKDNGELQTRLFATLLAGRWQDNMH